MSTPNKNELKGGGRVEKQKQLRIRRVCGQETATRCCHGMGLSKIHAPPRQGKREAAFYDLT